jgi:hypothetical protein
MTTFDTLTAARNLQAAGLDPKHADAIVDAMRSAVSEHVATKADIRELEQRLREVEQRLLIRLASIPNTAISCASSGAD